MQLFVVRGEEEVPALALGPLPVYVGRGPDNHLVVGDATVSTRHAVFWVEGARVWVRDCGSTNGTFVRDERVRGPVELADGELVRLGGETRIVARGSLPSVSAGVVRACAVEDVDAGVHYPILDGRLVLGAGPKVDVRLDGPSVGDTVVAVHTFGEIWRSTLDEEGPLALGEVFTVGGRRFRVVPSDAGVTRTRDGVPAERACPYRLTVTLDGVAGAEAVVEDPETGRRHVVEAENRAVLLYVLGRAAAEQRGEDDAGDAGWCADEDVITAVWGKRGSDGNSLHVLVHRLRKELREAGFDCWFLEKRRKAIRVALGDVRVT